MEYAKLLQQSAGKSDYRESPSITVRKVNELRNTIDKGGRQSLPRQQTYANKIQQHLSKEELKRKINDGAFRYKTSIQREYDDLILSKLRNRKDDEYMKTANKQSEFMKLLGDTNKMEYLSKVDPFGLFMLRQQNEKSKIDFLDQNKQLAEYKSLRDTDPERAQQMYQFSDNSLLKLFGNQPDIPSFDSGLSVPILSSYSPIPTKLPAPPPPVREPTPAVAPPPLFPGPEPLTEEEMAEAVKATNRFGSLPIEGEDDVDSFSLPSTTEVEPELDEGEEEIPDSVAESLVSENPDLSGPDASAEATAIVKEARKVAPVVEASANPEEFEEQVEEEPLAVELPLKKGKSKKDKLYNEILKSPELAELRQKLAKSRDMGLQEEFANLIADMDDMSYNDLSELKATIRRANETIRRANETIGNVEELEERGVMLAPAPSSKKGSKKGSKKDKRKQKQKVKAEGPEEKELEEDDDDAPAPAPVKQKPAGKFSKLQQYKLKFYGTDEFPHIATIEEASALSDEELKQLAKRNRVNPERSDGQPKPKSIIIHELYKKNRLAGDGFSGKGFRRLHTYPKHVIAGALRIVRHRRRHLNRNEYNREQAHHLTQMARLHMTGKGFFSDLRDKVGMWLFKNVHPMGRMIEYAKNYQK